jgi:aldose 1-epimerase
MKREVFGIAENGARVDRITLKSDCGFAVSCINYGCRLTEILLPAGGTPTNILLGYASLAEYESDAAYMGAVVGRYAGRIKGASFTLGGRKYALTQNEGNNYLHGSLHRRHFDVTDIADDSVTFAALSPDGEDGFSGNVRIRVKYSVGNDARLTMEYSAVSDADTFINLTNHAYFNLSGGADRTILSNRLRIKSNSYLEIGDDLCPTGKIVSAERELDFSCEKEIGRDIESKHPQLLLTGGYDHCYLLERGKGIDGPALAAQANDPVSGIGMSVCTTHPALQFYSGNFLQGDDRGGGYSKRSGFCLETQHCPDSPHHPEFPSALLRPGQLYHETAVLEFTY